ncbi:hypothetical protein OC835_000325 [Tilletia horrida]|nr:hypothetical protein OC835_000325 [Tilletia horrida]
MSTSNPSLSRTSYLETYTRVPVLDWAPVPNRPGHHIIQTELCAPDGSVVPVNLYMYWTGLAPPIGTFIGPVAMVAYNDDNDEVELASSREETEEMPGKVEDEDYVDRYLPQNGIRFRGRGEVQASDANEIVVVGFSYVNGRMQRWRAKITIPRTGSRWASFQAPRVGQICGFRGRLETFETVPHKAFVLVLESYSAPDVPSSQPKSPAKTTGNNAYLAARERYRQRKSSSTCGQASTSTSAQAEASTSAPVQEQADHLSENIGLGADAIGGEPSQGEAETAVSDNKKGKRRRAE